MNFETGARVWAYTPPPLDLPSHPGHWEEVTIGKLFGEGGTADVHVKEPFPASRTLIKIFHVDLGSKGKSAFYDRIWTISQRHFRLKDRLPFVAWPDAMVFADQSDTADGILGCTVPLFPNAHQLLSIATDMDSVRDLIPNATQDTLRLIALNIACGFELMHSREVLFGDPNAKNILINGETLDVKFIDADSYGMSLTPKGGSHDIYYPPPATTRGYRSPRTATISGPDNKVVKDYNKFDDNYALAIHMFTLLVPGFHPWNGISPETEAAACSRRFQYAGPTKSLSNNSPQMQLFNALPLPIQAAFVAAFVDVNPPTPTQWRALFKAHWGNLRGQSERLDYPKPRVASSP